MRGTFEAMFNRGPFAISPDDLAEMDDGAIYADLSVPVSFDQWADAPSILRGLGLGEDKAIRIAKSAERIVKSGRPYIAERIIIRRVQA